MPNSQHKSSKDTPTVAKLLEIDSDLAEAEADLIAQIQSIKGKRKSLKIVIDMFAPSDTAKPVEAPTTALANGTLEPSALAPQPAPCKGVDTNSALVEAVQETATQALDNSQATAASIADVNGEQGISTGSQKTPELDSLQVTPENTTTQVEGQPNRKQKKAPTGANRGRTTKTATGANSTKKTQGWQDYLREEFSDVPLSIAVSAVLQQQQEQVLEINTVVDAIFVQQMPPSVRDKARDRVNNILSEGARKNKWYRTDAGNYSMSASATSAT